MFAAAAPAPCRRHDRRSAGAPSAFRAAPALAHDGRSETYCMASCRWCTFSCTAAGPVVAGMTVTPLPRGRAAMVGGQPAVGSPALPTEPRRSTRPSVPAQHPVSATYGVGTGISSPARRGRCSWTTVDRSAVAVAEGRISGRITARTIVGARAPRGTRTPAHPAGAPDGQDGGLPGRMVVRHDARRPRRSGVHHLTRCTGRGVGGPSTQGDRTSFPGTYRPSTRVFSTSPGGHLWP